MVWLVVLRWTCAVQRQATCGPLVKRHRGMLRTRVLKGEYLTNAAAKYPKEMNKLLAKELATRARRCKAAKLSVSQAKTPAPAVRLVGSRDKPQVVSGLNAERFAMREGASADAEEIVKVGTWQSTLARRKEIWPPWSDLVHGNHRSNCMPLKM